MKKIARTLWAILAAGAVALAAGSCDTSVDEKEWNPETPTTWKNMGGTVDGTVTAKWDFSGLTADSSGQWSSILKTSTATSAKGDVIDNGTEFKPSSGEGATLTVSGGGNGFKANSGAGILQIQKGSVSLADPAKGYGNLLLTLDSPANLVIKAQSVSAGEESRYVGIKAADKDGKVADDADYIVSKDGIGKEAVTLAVVGMKAGYYKIYSNGTGFVSIDCSVADGDSSLAAPAEINKLVLYNGTEKAADSISVENLIGELSLKAMNVNGDKTEDLSSSAVWTSTNESVATVEKGVLTIKGEGKTVIRARIGRFYDERTVTVTPCTHTVATFFAEDNFPDADTEMGVDWTADSVKSVAEKLLKASKIGDSVTVSEATISFFDDNVSWSPEPTVVAKEKATGDLSQAWDKALGVKMKPNKYSNGKFTQNFKFAEISFDVTPKSGSAKIGLKIKARGGKNVNITPTVASDEKTAVKVGSSTTEVSELLSDETISAKTTIKIAFSVADADKDGIGFGFQDLTLSAE